MAAARIKSRRKSPAASTRQGLRSQMRITKNNHTLASEKARVKREIKEEIKKEIDEIGSLPTVATKAQSQSPDLPSVPNPPRKTKQTKHITSTPFPDFPHPTIKECHLAHSVLTELHGERKRPAKVVASPTVTGCGESPSVLDALVRTILSQNTSDTNSDRAKHNMDMEYGGSDQWEAIFAGGQPRLQKAIQSGGLSVTKSKVIITILGQVRAKYGKFSLDHLFGASDEDAMNEMLAFDGVGPKTASCVLLFCLQRPSFAVDTHVYRITGFLGWRPREASRGQAQAHLDALVPDDLKYPLHVLLIAHGRGCKVCSAKASGKGSCKLRQAFK